MSRAALALALVLATGCNVVLRKQGSLEAELREVKMRPFTPEDRDALLRRFSTDDFSEVLIPSDTDGVGRLLKLAYAHPPWTPEFARRQTLEVVFGSHREEQARLLESLWSELSSGRLRSGEVRAPTLLIWGRDDPVFPVELGVRLAPVLKAQLRIIEDARHFPNAEHAAEFNRLVRAFLDAELAPAKSETVAPLER